MPLSADTAARRPCALCFRSKLEVHVGTNSLGHARRSCRRPRPQRLRCRLCPPHDAVRACRGLKRGSACVSQTILRLTQPWQVQEALRMARDREAAILSEASSKGVRVAIN